MSEIGELLNQARALGEAIARHPRVRAFVAAQQAASADNAARELMEKYQGAAEELAALQAAGKPIEPELKRRIAAAEQALASNDMLKELMRRQADYIELMSKVQDAMESPMSAPPRQ